MAQNLKDVRRRIQSVKNLRKITSAMKMVAAAKLRRAQARAEAARPYAEALRGVLLRLAANARGVRDPLLAERSGDATVAIVVASDRGLAGAYNANLNRAAAQKLAGTSSPQVVAVGRKARDYFRHRGVRIAAEFTGLEDALPFSLADRIAGEATRLFLDGQCDRVLLVYAQFVNPVLSRPVAVQLLPLAGDELGGGAPDAPRVQGGARPQGAAEGEYIFEPDAEAVLAKLLPHYVSVLVYRALLEAKASEFGARMAAMDNATRNAGELIDRLTLQSFRVRQAAITNEILEIVAGANALRG